MLVRVVDIHSVIFFGVLFCLPMALSWFLNYRFSKLKDFTPNTVWVIEPKDRFEMGVILISGAIFILVGFIGAVVIAVSFIALVLS